MRIKAKERTKQSWGMEIPDKRVKSPAVSKLGNQVRQ